MNILSADYNVLESCILEASAGTGKTFAIEQLITRLIIERGFKFEEILAVTFTRVAARDMRNRIRSNLEKFSRGFTPEYLQAIYDNGLKTQAQQRLKEALLSFDQTQVFTIHGFCQRILGEFAFEGRVALQGNYSRGRRALREVVCDFLRNGVESVEEVETLLKESRQELKPLIEKIAYAIEQPGSASSLIKKVAQQCRTLWIEKQQVEEVLTPDSLLEKMKEALQHGAFLKKTREKYRVLIIDEFQDTDPLSWGIFETIFLQDTDHIVYLVGDPKQSIYGFRNADIYTYFQAREKLAKRESLTTNFRSRPELIKVLNLLFSNSDWISLPTSTDLSYSPSSPGRLSGKLDQEHAVHFFAVQGTSGRERNWPTKQLEQDSLFPFIASEMLRLHDQYQLPFKEMAVLVKDRFQAERLHNFLKSLSIPVSVKQTLNLVETPGFIAFEELLNAVFHPDDRSAVQRALYGPLLTEKVSFHYLQHVLMQQGFPVLCHEIKKTGLIIDSALKQTMEILLESACPPQQLLQVMNELKKITPEEDPRLKIQNDGESDQVAILTLFGSKGLEFDVVFALGLASRQEIEDDNEKEAEKMRQLYVAMTRAREKLYIPLLFGRASSSRLSYIESFWQKRFHVNLEEGTAFEILGQLFKGAPEVIFTYPEIVALDPFMKALEVEESSLKTEGLLPSFPKIFPVSFSSLSEKEAVSLKHLTPLPEEIPIGTEVGVIIHAILEKIFSKGLHDCSDLLGIRQLIEEMSMDSVLHSWSQKIEKMIVQALEFPLWEEFCLKKLPLSQVTAEVEFLFPDKNRLIKGFIDLFFFYKQRWYVLDWKTNWIPSNHSLKEWMKRHDYFLQAALYKEAMQRYVKLFDNKREEPLRFGGVIYLFLRGPSVYHVSDEEMAFSLEAR